MAFKLSKIKSRKADILSIWWFLVITLIGTGIVIGTFMFASKKIDVRLTEAEILNDRIIQCFTNLEKLNSEVKSGIDIFEKCGLNKEITNATGIYYIKIEVLDEFGNNLGGFPLILGNRAFEEDCLIGAKMKENLNYPVCDYKELVVFDENGKNYTLKVNSGSNSEKR